MNAVMLVVERGPGRLAMAGTSYQPLIPKIRRELATMLSMVRIVATLIVFGDRFSPAEAEALAGFQFTQKSERGVLGTTGRYMGQPVPYGWAELEATDPGSFLTTADGPFFEAAAALTRAAQVQGEVDVRLHVDVEHDAQCNLEIAPGVLAAVSRLGVPLTLTCYEAG